MRALNIIKARVALESEKPNENATSFALAGKRFVKWSIKVAIRHYGLHRKLLGCWYHQIAPDYNIVILLASSITNEVTSGSPGSWGIYGANDKGKEIVDLQRPTLHDYDDLSGLASDVERVADRLNKLREIDDGKRFDVFIEVKTKLPETSMLHDQQRLSPKFHVHLKNVEQFLLELRVLLDEHSADRP